jgi:hypothetical protein
VLALEAHGRARFALEALDDLGRGAVEEQFYRYPLVELHVKRGDDDAHAALTEHALDPVLPGEDFAFGDGGAHERAPPRLCWIDVTGSPLGNKAEG